MNSKATFPAKPLHDRVIVKPFPPDEKSAGGIIVPDSVKQRPSKARVVAIGCGLKDRPMELKENDIVFHIKDAGTLLEYNSEEYYIMSDRDCLAILPE